MRKSWIYIIIIFLLAANAALVTTLIISNKNNNAGADNKEYYNRKKDWGRHKSGGFQKYLKENLNLSKAQIREIDSISNSFHHNKGAYFKNIHKLKISYINELAQENPDTILLKEYADSLGNIHAHLIFLDHQHYRDIRSVCNEEQAEIFDSLGKEHMHRMKRKNFGGPKRERRHNFDGSQ